MSRYELYTDELEDLRTAVSFVLFELFDSFQDGYVDKTNWDKFVSFACDTDTREHDELIRTDSILAVIPKDPFSMLGLVNYINQFYADSYGAEHAITIWKMEGKDSIIRHIMRAIIGTKISLGDFLDYKMDKEDEDDETEEEEEEEEEIDEEAEHYDEEEEVISYAKGNEVKFEGIHTGLDLYEFPQERQGFIYTITDNTVERVGYKVRTTKGMRFAFFPQFKHLVPLVVYNVNPSL